MFDPLPRGELSALWEKAGRREAQIAGGKKKGGGVTTYAAQVVDMIIHPQLVEDVSPRVHAQPHKHKDDTDQHPHNRENGGGLSAHHLAGWLAQLDSVIKTKMSVFL